MPASPAPPRRRARSRPRRLGRARHQGQQIAERPACAPDTRCARPGRSGSARGRPAAACPRRRPEPHQLRAHRQHDGARPRRSGGADAEQPGRRIGRPATTLGRAAVDGRRPCRPGSSTCRRSRRPRRWPARRRALPGEPCCTIRPWRMMQIVSLIDSASSWSWVTRTKVMPTSCCRFCSSICMSRRSLRSSAASGSSSSSTVGRLTSARASATRCCCPPDSSQTRRRAIAGQAHQLEHRVDPARRAPPCPAGARAASARRRCWRRHRDAGTGRSAGTPCSPAAGRAARPPSTARRCARRRRSAARSPRSGASEVVLPQPDGPRKVKNEPRATRRSTPSTRRHRAEPLADAQRTRCRAGLAAGPAPSAADHPPGAVGSALIPMGRSPSTAIRTSADLADNPPITDRILPIDARLRPLRHPAAGP